MKEGSIHRKNNENLVIKDSTSVECSVRDFDKTKQSISSPCLAHSCHLPMRATIALRKDLASQSPTILSDLSMRSRFFRLETCTAILMSMLSTAISGTQDSKMQFQAIETKTKTMDKDHLPVIIKNYEQNTK